MIPDAIAQAVLAREDVARYLRSSHAGANGRERVFDLSTAFACGVFGALCRQHQPPRTIIAVAELLGVAAIVEKKQEACR